MLIILIVAFLFLITFFTYLYQTYKYSKNKKLIFKTGVFRPLLITISILAITPLIVNFLLPDTIFAFDTINPVVLDSAKLSEMKSTGDYAGYYLEVIEATIQNINYPGILIASLILIAWFIYIKQLDFFDQDKPFYVYGTLLAGILSTFATLIISIFLRNGLNIQYRGEPLYDMFIHFFLGVGVVEEFMKLLPLFFIMFFTRQLKEPYDYILYACISALGFAFIENLLYFQQIDGVLVAGRALMAAVAHIMFSTFCVYGIILAKYKYKYKKSPALLFLISFTIGSFAHGLYDYLATESMIFMLIVFFVFALQSFSIIINNTINNSRYFTYQIYFNAEQSKFKLATILSSVLAISYIIDSFKYGKSEANNIFITSCFVGALFIIFYVTNFSSLDLVKGYWRPIKLRFKPDYDDPAGLRGIGAFARIFKYNFILPLNLVNYKIWIKPPYYNEWLYDQMYDTKGSIVDRVKLYDNDTDDDKVDIDWFLVKLEEPLNFENINNGFVLIKLESKESSLIHDADIRGYLRLIPSLEMIKEKRPKKKNFEYAGYVLIDSYQLPDFETNKLIKKPLSHDKALAKV